MTEKPMIIAGPCAAENLELMKNVADAMIKLSDELGFDYVFKASFDKANRSSVEGDRGPGLDKALSWFQTIKKEFDVKTLTDVHETNQVKSVSEVCDILQIPAFLCRQSDLVIEAARYSSEVNIKKGQFLAPESMAHIVKKAKDTKAETKVYITERGTSFGYGNLVVDMRAFPIMATSGAPQILDITHSTQIPASGGSKTSSGERQFAPVLARAATAAGYLDGYFLEVHTDPSSAISDKDAQLTIDQATRLLRQIVPLWKHTRTLKDIDCHF